MGGEFSIHTILEAVVVKFTFSVLLLLSSGPLDLSSLRELPPGHRLLHPPVPAWRADRLQPRLQHYSEGPCPCPVLVTLKIKTHIFILFLLDVQHINELTMKLDLQNILRDSEAIYLQLVQCKVRPAPSLHSGFFIKKSEKSEPNLRLWTHHFITS